MTDLDTMAAMIRSEQMSHRDAQAIVDGTPGLREHMAATSVLPPMAWTVFASRYPDSVGAAGLTDPLPWSMDLSRELAQVNDEANAIPPDTRPQGLDDTWDVRPAVADCNDYAVTKRDALLRRGHPASVLLLAEVIMPGGKHHLVLIVRTSRDDVVLDSLTPALMSRQDVKYKFLRVQSPADPNAWTSS